VLEGKTKIKSGWEWFILKNKVLTLLSRACSLESKEPGGHVVYQENDRFQPRAIARRELSMTPDNRNSSFELIQI